MKKAAILLGLLLYVLILNAQKPALDTGILQHWPIVENAAISNDGKYAQYSIRNIPTGSSTLFVKAIGGEWVLSFQGSVGNGFTSDDNHAVFINSHDSLIILKLGTSRVSYIPSVSSYVVLNRNGISLVAYYSTENKELAILDLKTGISRYFKKVIEYHVNSADGALVYTCDVEANLHDEKALWWVDPVTGNRLKIWQGKNADNFVLDSKGRTLAYRVTDTVNGKDRICFYIYKSGADSAFQLVCNESGVLEKGFTLDNILEFSKDGARLMVNLKEGMLNYPSPNAVQVDVWSYRDAKLQSIQLEDTTYSRHKPYLGSIALHGEPHVLCYQQKGEHLIVGGAVDGDYIIFDSTQGDYSEWNWSSSAQPLFYIVSTWTGERRALRMPFYDISPTERYVVLRDLQFKNLFLYENSTGIIRNVSQSLPIPLIDENYDEPQYKNSRSIHPGLWLCHDSIWLIYDKYDIWKIDPLGNRKAVNLTNGYGRRHHLIFRCVESLPDNPNQIIITAFSERDKSNGFYQISLQEITDPVFLTMESCAYYDAGSFIGRPPIRASGTNIYLVSKESAKQSPNYFWTSDFKVFYPVSEEYPERAYNWLTDTLVSFRTLDGHTNQGVLYKPENFDPHKKYPVIIHYYELKSNNLNKFNYPGGTEDELGIAWFASHGYLVFTPDIYHYSSGEIGQSAYNSVIGAAEYLMAQPYVDASKLGIQGHSFGGFETNYLVTHTDLFSAAVSSSGMSDLVSQYGDLWSTGQTYHDYYENRQGNMDATLWQRPDLYLRNSPIFRADKVKTPILMVSNKADHNVSFAQGVEFFTALRRLGRRVWMLQYDNGGHGVAGNDLTDYTVRMTQFFDHYLKGLPPTIWMTRGIPAKMKGVDNGLELDDSIPTPGPGLLTTEEQKKVNALMHKKPITITIP